MYKDKDKQRETQRERQRRYRHDANLRRDKQGVTDKLVDAMVSGDVALADKCADEILDKPERTAQGNIRVSKPSDADYEPQCETTKAFVEDRAKRKSLCFGIRTEGGKRGKDIKCFADLPSDVQETIAMMSWRDGKIDQTIKVNRAAIAINYQHLFPDRFHSTGL